MLPVDGRLVLHPEEWFRGVLIKELPMFTNTELNLIMRSLVLMQKSCNRLAAKEEQPVAVAEEYRKASNEIHAVWQKASAAYVEQVKSVAVKK